MSHAAPITVMAPPRRSAELAWVCSVLFDRWLGLPARIVLHEEQDVIVRAGQGQVVWTDVFLANSDAIWLQPESLPAAPMAMWPLPCRELTERIGESSLAQCCGDGRYEASCHTVRLPIDITGSAFFMLSRYEEAVIGAVKDRFGRIPGATSLAYRSGLSLRPLVDEWVELLWWALQQVAPGLERRPRQASTWVSCDVDTPYSPGVKSLPLLLRQSASLLWKDRSPQLAGQAVLNAAATRLGITRFDAFDTFDWMMACNERAGHKMTFFFLSVHRPKIIDGCYELAEPRIQQLLGKVLKRGHEVGLHGSFRSVDDVHRLSRELEELNAAVSSAGSKRPILGSRQHYLRWKGETAAQLEALGLEFDSTLGHPDIVGFRCGTSHSYPLFDLDARRPLRLLERPLVLMEATVMAPAYMGLGCGQRAWDLMVGMRDRCRRFGGEFSLLWHNSYLRTAGARDLYEALLR
jgi:hypothetical protein